jgi:4-amino-4-deoxy-L-arabinose transferase-like glycosyltransferase
VRAVRNNQVLFLLLIGAIVLIAGLGLRDPWPPDEPRFALIAKDMVESGDWLIPQVGGVLYADKPPLFFWLVAAGYAVTQSISVALLLPAFFAGLGVLWLVHDLARRLWGPREALWAAATLLTTVQFPLQMKSGQIDGLLCFWTTLGLYGLCRHLLLGPAWRWYAIAGLSCGLGVITKGVGFLPFLVLIPYLYARGARWPVPGIGGSNGQWLLAPLAFSVAIALWLVPMLLVTTGSSDPDLLQYRDNILLKQTLTRYTDAWGHLRPPWYLLTNAAPWLWLPLSPLLPWLLPLWIRDLRERATVTLLLGGWILLVLVFFSLSDGKRSVYIFPALPALVLLSAHHLPTIVSRNGPGRLLFGLALLVASLPLAGGIVILADSALLRPWLDVRQLAPSLSWTLAGIGLIAMSIAAWFRTRHSAAALAAVMVTLWISIPLLVYPMIDASRSGRTIIDTAASLLTEDQSLGFAGWKEQLLLQWNRPAVHFGYRRHDDEAESLDAASWLARDAKHRLLLPDSIVEPCFDPAQMAYLGTAHRHRWFLTSGAAILPRCRGRSSVTDENAFMYDPSRPHAEGTTAFRNAI